MWLSRAQVEAALRIEGAVLADARELLRKAVPLTGWPEQLQRALLAALTEEGEDIEAQKARWLRRHLFRDTDLGLPPLPSSSLPSIGRRIAERLRADLIGLVPLGCGLKMLAASGRFSNDFGKVNRGLKDL